MIRVFIFNCSKQKCTLTLPDWQLTGIYDVAKICHYGTTCRLVEFTVVKSVIVDDINVRFGLTPTTDCKKFKQMLIGFLKDYYQDFDPKTD